VALAKSNPCAETADILGAMTAATDNPYFRDSVLTATPEQLQLMLYDGAIRFAAQGRDALLKKDYETSCEKLIKAQNIILEMQAGLNFEVNRELCQRVAAIYNFIFRKLIDANTQRDTGAIDDALKVLRMERETWQILVDKVNREREGTKNATFAEVEAGQRPALSVES
jgi:flagellar protein FliS